jgi:hypothetical protein
VRVALLLVIAAGLAVAAPASAAPSGRIASHCSASGDVCYGIFDDRGVIRFQLTLAAKYFSRYRICVRPPQGATTCRSFPVKRVGSQFGRRREVGTELSFARPWALSSDLEAGTPGPGACAHLPKDRDSIGTRSRRATPSIVARP